MNIRKRVVGAACALAAATIALTACGVSPNSTPGQGPAVTGASGNDYTCYSAHDESLRTSWNMLADAAGWSRPSAVNSYTGAGDNGYMGARFANGVAVFAGHLTNGGSTATSWIVPVNPLFSALPANIKTGMTQNAPTGVNDADFGAVVGHLTDCLAAS